MAYTNPNYINSISRNDQQMSGINQQLMLGLGGQGGFLQGAINASNTGFYNPDGTPKVRGQQVAGFSPDQLQAFGMTRGNIGARDPYYNQAQSLYRGGYNRFGRGMSDVGQTYTQGRNDYKQSLDRAGGVYDKGFQDYQASLGRTQDIYDQGFQDYGRSLDQTGDIYGAAKDDYAGRLSNVEDIYSRNLKGYGTDLDEVGDIYRQQRSRRFNPSDISKFSNPYEDEVVQKTISDVMDTADQREMGQEFNDIKTGGESAFGSRARLGAADRLKALGEGLGESISNIRRGGYDSSMAAAERDYGRIGQQDAAAAQGLCGVAGSAYNAAQGYGAGLLGTGGSRYSADTGYGSQMAGLGSQRYNANTGYGSQMGGLGSQAYGASTGYGGQLAGLGSQAYGADTGYGGQMSGIQSQLYGADTGYAGQLTGMGDMRYNAGQQDINSLLGIGASQQGLTQRDLDAQRLNAMTADRAGMEQFNYLTPYFSNVTQMSGPSNMTTSYMPRPSALQAGLATGLSTFGAMGNYFNQPNQ